MPQAFANAAAPASPDRFERGRRRADAGISRSADAIATGRPGAFDRLYQGTFTSVLDGAPATIDPLPGIAALVDGRVPVLLDGGVRRGADVVKALARGATAVGVGRPVRGAAGRRRTGRFERVIVGR